MDVLGLGSHGSGLLLPATLPKDRDRLNVDVDAGSFVQLVEISQSQAEDRFNVLDFLEGPAHDVPG